MKKRTLPLAKVYGLLETGPVLLLTTMHKGKPNVMRQCVLNIPTVELASQAVKCGNVSGRELDKFEAFGLTTAPATLVAAPVIEACFANLECRGTDTRLMNCYDFFVLEVLKARIDPRCKNPRTLHHRGCGVFMVAGDTLRLPSSKR